MKKGNYCAAGFNPQTVCVAVSDTNPEGTARTILFAAAIPRFRRGADEVCIPYRLASVSLMHADKPANFERKQSFLSRLSILFDSRKGGGVTCPHHAPLA